MSKKKKIKELEVFSVGTKVLLNNRIEGVVVGIIIREKKLIAYEVAYWADEERKVETFAECELKFDLEADKIRIGFSKS